MSCMSTVTSTICVFALALPAFAEDDASKKAPAEWQGAWKLQSIERGETDRNLADEPIQCTVKGDRFLYGGEEFATLKIVGEGPPKTIDMTFNGSKEAKEGIYLIEKETLKICLSWDEGGVKERPQEFSTKDQPGRRILEFRRVEAPAPGEEPPALGFIGMALKTDDSQNGIVVVDALEGSPAKKAGIEKDDLLQEVDGVKVTDLTSTIVHVRKAKPGTEVVLKVHRQGEAKELKVKVGVFPIRILLD